MDDRRFRWHYIPYAQRGVEVMLVGELWDHVRRVRRAFITKQTNNGEFTLAVTNFTFPKRVEVTRKGFDRDELEAYALALIRLTDTE
jgi:hypothetical protein